MRHLKTEELLLYAEGELEQRELCRHVPHCVECKAKLVDLQETYVHAANAIRQQAERAPVRPLQMEMLRQRIAVEAQALSGHLSTQDLLLSVEDGLSAGGQAHLSRCGDCQHRAADLHVQLAEIEVELHRQVAFELPEERRAAALAALRARLRIEIDRKTAPAFSIREWLASLPVPRVPALASYSAAFAAVCLAAWLGIAGIATGPVPAPESFARLELPGAPELAPAERPEPPVALAGQAPSTIFPAREPSRSPVRFAWAPGSALREPAAPASLVRPPAPALLQAVPRADSLAFELLASASLPEPLPVPPGASFAPPPAPGSHPSPEKNSIHSVVDGTWMLVQAGLWGQGLSAGGPAGRIRFSGSVASDRERLAAERALAAVADGRPVEFAISERNARPAQLGEPLPAGLGLSHQPTGAVRNSLLEHYEDAARRSFLEPDRSLLESEIDRYVTGILRRDTELLSHANALTDFLSHPDMEAARSSDRFRKVLRYHLDAIWTCQSEIHDLLSEVLPRRFWAHRSRPGDPEPATGGIRSESLALREDALALDRALTSLLFGAGDALDARAGSNLSINSLLRQLRQRAGRLRDANRQLLDLD